MNNHIDPIVKHVLNIAMHVLYNFFFKMGHSRPLSVHFQSFQTTISFSQQRLVKIIHLTSGSGIQTHDLLNMSLLL